jgi:hypothetical protein
MSSVTAPAGAESVRLSLMERVIGIFTSPRRVFESFIAHPKWLDVLIVYMVIGILSYIPMQPIIRQNSIDKAIEQIDRADIPEERREEARQRQLDIMDKMLSVPVGIATVVVATPIMLLFWAAVLLFIYGFLLGGRLSFKQSLAVSSHLSLILLLGGLLKLPLILAKKSMYVAVSPAVLLPENDPSSLAWAVLNTFDFFNIWMLLVLAAGMVPLANISTGKARTGAVIVLVLVLLMNAAGAMLSGMQG